ncbi:Putative diheme cytochrome c-553 [Caballeronia glathei]|uniref:Cytochrome C n=2 Tax=Caballeronia glathei TaxID=60547 RepID=A0A069PKS1_9BURK|nr:cytochrome C [Caballeronia glathei]CDY74406.1 Putative diheme cytochrome c-553 [Caballeronia glathei]
MSARRHAPVRQRMARFASAALVVFAVLAAAYGATHGAAANLPARVAVAAQVPPAVVKTDTVTQAELVKRGEYLARAGDCIACHTADPARPFAGGVPVATPFGTIYTPNITSDPDTGIGRWTDADFLRAMHEGIGKGGERLYPAFPYVEYTRVTTEDVLAIRAYLTTVAPIHSTPPRNDLMFPFNQRWLMALWNLFNFSEGRFVPDPKKSAEFNRGAYLVEGLAHCGECHTPRNVMQGLRTGERLGGGAVAGWQAYNITPDKNGGVGHWSDDDLIHYLATGVAPGRANAAGPMADVVVNSTQHLTQEDLRSIVVYLRSVPAIGGGAARPRDSFGRPAPDDVTGIRGTAANTADGARLFIANCASCHHWTGEGAGGRAPGAYPPLIRNSATGANAANNLTLVILHGVNRTTKDTAAFMPAFGPVLTDAQIAAIAGYVTIRFGNPQAATSAEQVAKLRQAR